MRGPLSLVIDDGNGARHVSRRTSGLRFKRSAYGGDVDLACQVVTGRGTFTDLGPGDTVTVYDGRTGATAWEGTAHQPGVTAGPLGESYDLQAFGGAVRLMAVSDAVAYVHALDADWKRTANSTKGTRVDEEQSDSGEQRLDVAWDKGFNIEEFDLGEFGNRTFADAGLKIGRAAVEVDAGITSIVYVQRVMTGPSLGSLAPAASRASWTGVETLAATISGGGITLGDDVVAVRGIYTGVGEEIPSKNRWLRFQDMRLRQVLKDKYGDEITGAANYDTDTVLAHEVIADMLGRGMCPGLDMDKVTVAEFSYAIDALSWLDGIKMGDALNELRIFEPNLLWTVYGDAADFASWDDRGVRYVVSARDGGVSHPGEEVTLCDRVFVSWTDRRGRQRVTKVTDDSVTVKQEAEPITLPEGTGSAANAQRVGEKALELTNNPPKAGTAVMRRPILDLVSGAVVLPHEIVPGWLVQEQETGDVFRCSETDYDDDAGACTLTLGEPVRPLETVIARLERGQRRRKR